MPTKPPRRTQKERTETTRAKLMDAAVRCICRRGYGATTLQAVATEAGLTKGALQHHFADKRTLMAAVVEAGWAETMDRLRAVSPTDGSIAERVDGIVDHWIAAYSVPICQAAREVNTGARSDPVLRERHINLYREARELIEADWMRVFSDAPVSPARTRSASRIVWALLGGILSDLDASPKRQDVLHDLELMKETARWMLTTPSE